MKSAFSRRQPRKVEQVDEDDGNGSDHGGSENRDQGVPNATPLYRKYLTYFATPRLTAYVENAPTVIRPSITSRGSSKIKKRSSLRTSFGPGGTSMIEDDDESGPVVFTPKKSNLGRQAIEKNALRKTLAANISSDRLPSRQIDDRPSYSSDYLNELKTSTPSTPKDLASRSNAEDQDSKALDLAAKFGSDLIVQDTNSAIPTDAEIREKKERRARLVKEQDFISLNDEDGEVAEEDDDESNDERSLLPYAQSKSSIREETRLVRDDEDVAEGFDEFVSDGRIALGRKAEREQKKRHKVEIRNMIDEAEGGGSDDSDEDESEVERNAAYEAAQTKKGMEGLQKDEERVKPRRPRTPPKIMPLPTLNGCLERLKGQMAAKQYSLSVKERRVEVIRKEREDIRVRQEEVQQLLRETGEKYERLRAKAGSEGQVANGVTVAAGDGERAGIGIMASRGLETLGDG